MGDAFNMRHPLTGGGMMVTLSDIAVIHYLFKPLRDLNDASSLCRYLESFYTLRKADVEEGIVVGGGCTFLRLAAKVDAIKLTIDNDEQKVGAYIVKRALSYPLKLIAKIASGNGSVVMKKVVKNRPGVEDELKAMEDRARLAACKGVEEMSKVEIYLGMEEEKVELKSGKVELEEVVRLKSDLVRERKRLNYVKAAQEVEISELTKELRINLEKVVVQHDKFGYHLLKMGYSKTEVNNIMEDTYVEEEEDEADGTGVVIWLDGVPPHAERENQVDDIVNPENDKVELESALLSEEEIRQYNQEFTAEFGRMRRANKDKDDQHVKVHFKFVEATQIVNNLTRKIEERDARISKGQKELVETKEETAKLKSLNNVLIVKSKEADMARYRI
ncbi:hypothetical protein GIB67_021008 [Kingdonia uniflora]|uniref:Squalene epoxidase domain-containing protein n=1 Tax=Kingdonia uniflora TaxID=39325 RepID=A0A7J7N6K7_9MAGN|nr:hypothetical protein GIB67_021008 [Kingdonia uniflora]